MPRSRLSQIRFVLASAPSEIARVRPYVELARDNWDDFGFKTSFSATLYLIDRTVKIGSLKIIEMDQESGRIELEPTFTGLGTNYCSLGQEIGYYETLMSLDAHLRRQYLRALRDAAEDPDVQDRFEKARGWKTSLVRFGQAENALVAGRELLRGVRRMDGRLGFKFTWSHHNTITPLQFAFDDSGQIPGRCHALIGYNGVGKTSMLADLAMAASRVSEPGTSAQNSSTIEGDDTTFGSVVAVSYSAFDTFQTPHASSSDAATTDSFGYVYCGLRKQTSVTKDAREKAYKLKSIQEIEAEFANALRGAGQRSSQGHLSAAFNALSTEPSFGRIGVDLEVLGQGLGSDAIIENFKLLSTGHKIVLNIVTQLAAHLRHRSLVLIDEPETHLHPPLTAALLRAIQILLKAFDSYAIIATHSPVVIQEIPSNHVTILQRIGSVTSGTSPEIETFGENLGTLTRHVFSLDSSSTDFQGVLAELAQSNTLERIEAFFPNGLSVQARALVLNYLARRA